ncbi:uncharacterized protein LOC128549671 [Mercenaria mercenaria]|uniref:uncharacterized protein LOC128549671 n=1 Tax=Mercenaria mercenaria TaxID=6596 RepID=UPI00234F102B|nr:uncharacterized protein LOC128549671 [Mercenaria mercenaria]
MSATRKNIQKYGRHSSTACAWLDLLTFLETHLGLLYRVLLYCSKVLVDRLEPLACGSYGSLLESRQLQNGRSTNPVYLKSKKEIPENIKRQKNKGTLIKKKTFKDRNSGFI